MLNMNGCIPEPTPQSRLSMRGARRDPPRPEIGFQAVFEPGDRCQVGPTDSAEDVAQHCVIDARALFRAAEASAVESDGESESKSASDLSSRVVAGFIGPGGAERARGLAFGPGHTATVGEAVKGLREAHRRRTVVHVGHSGGNNHQLEACGDAVSRRIKEFVPDFDPAYWRAIEGFVRAAVFDAEPDMPRKSGKLLTVVARHTLWCWQTAGLPLEREIVFSRDVISEYIQHGCATVTPSSRSTMRSRLLRVSEALLPRELAPRRLPPLPNSSAMAPYSESELTAFRSWAGGQATAARRRDALTLLALGAGGGLSTVEIGDVRAEHIGVDSLGVLVAVSGERPRLVPVLRQWEAALIEAAAERDPGSPMFRLARSRNHPNLVTNFLGKCNGVGARPQTRRLRATWIVTHLAASTPVVPFMAASGVQSLEALTRYLRYLPGVDAAQARRGLRDALREAAE